MTWRFIAPLRRSGKLDNVTQEIWQRAAVVPIGKRAHRNARLFGHRDIFAGATMTHKAGARRKLSAPAPPRPASQAPRVSKVAQRPAQLCAQRDQTSP